MFRTLEDTARMDIWLSGPCLGFAQKNWSGDVSIIYVLYLSVLDVIGRNWVNINICLCFDEYIYMHATGIHAKIRRASKQIGQLILRVLVRDMWSRGGGNHDNQTLLFLEKSRGSHDSASVVIWTKYTTL